MSKTRRRYVVELTEAQIGLISMSLDYQLQIMSENQSYITKRELNFAQKLYDSISEIRQNGLKTIK